MPKSEKHLLIAFEEKMNRIYDATQHGLNPYESEEEKEERIKKNLKNYSQFCKYYFPNYCQAEMADFHIKTANYLHKNWNVVALIQWAREFAKSTHYLIMFPLFLYFNDELEGMMVGSANQDLAANLLSDIKANFEANQRLINDFGDQKSFGNWSEDRFVTKKGIGFYAFGKNQSPRGTRFSHRRPNYGAIDDLNDRKMLKNDSLCREAFEWVKEDFMGALSTKKWKLVIPQNKFHKNTVTALFENDRDIKTYLSRVNMLNDEGESNWPQYFSTKICEEKIKSVGHLSAQREYFNKPVEEGKIFKRDYFTWVKRLPFKHYDYLLQYTDPSYKNSDKSDYKASILIGKKGIYFDVLKAFVDKVSIKEMFKWHYLTDQWVGDPSSVRHYMEANFIQDMHLKVLKPLAKEKGRFLRLSGDYRSKPDKFQRISSLEPMFENALIRFNKAEENNPHMNRLVDQLLGFEKGSNISDDGPDALEGGITKLSELMIESEPPKAVARKKRSKYAF